MLDCAEQPWRRGPPKDGGALAPDPLSDGMLYFSYTPYAPSCGGGPPCGAPPDPTGTLDSQTWLWHHGHFARESPSRAPRPGPYELMVSDARLGRVIAIDSGGRLWAWTGATWQPLASGRGPQQGAAAVNDPALGDLVVFATRTASRSPTSQTWLWNGSRWIIGP